MSDLNQLREIFEMAEILEEEFENSLTLKLPNASDDKIVTVTFVFDDENQLIGGHVE